MENNPQENKKNLSIFWVETDKIKPNPMQPRHEFDEARLRELADSIRQYGILQPLVVVRNEKEVPTGTEVSYELIAGERRLRASKMAGLKQVPVIIRQEDAERVKLELALIENVQREDLNAIERAKAFKQLMESFDLKQREVAEKIGKSREFVANTLRLLSLPQEFQEALIDGKINEGHTRPLLMLSDKPEAQKILFKDIIYKKLSVRDAEKVSRRIAYERARKHDEMPDSKTRKLEEELASTLGTRVVIERKGLGGVVAISFFSDEELQDILDRIAHEKKQRAASVAVVASDSGESSEESKKGVGEESWEEQKKESPKAYEGMSPKNSSDAGTLNLSDLLRKEYESPAIQTPEEDASKSIEPHENNRSGTANTDTVLPQATQESPQTPADAHIPQVPEDVHSASDLEKEAMDNFTI